MYLVLDLDNNSLKARTVLEAKREADKFNIQIILSNPCFEIWFLEHFLRMSKRFEKSEEVITELKKYIPNYVKKLDVFPLLQDKVDIALSNCHYLAECNRKKNVLNIIDKNPSTDVYQIIETILDK